MDGIETRRPGVHRGAALPRAGQPQRPRTQLSESGVAQRSAESQLESVAPAAHSLGGAEALVADSVKDSPAAEALGPAAAAPATRPAPAPQPGRDSLGHRPDIQGLRAVAVILVALTHAGVPLLTGGYVGVDVFFVLSGFLITGLLLAEAHKNGSISLIDFYVRRARRILPAAALTLLATDVAAFFLLNFVRA